MNNRLPDIGAVKLSTRSFDGDHDKALRLPFAFFLAVLLSAVLFVAVFIYSESVKSAVFSAGLFFLAFGLVLMRKLLQDPTRDKEEPKADILLLKAMVSKESVPLIITDLKGQFYVTNQAFDALNIPVSSIDLLLTFAIGDVDKFSLFEALKFKQPLSKQLFFHFPNAKANYAVSNDYLGDHVIWMFDTTTETMTDDFITERLANWPVGIIERLNAGLILENTAGDIIFMNDRAKDLIGMKPEDRFPKQVPVSSDLQRLYLPDNSYMEIICEKKPIPTYNYLPSPGYYYVFILQGSQQFTAGAAVVGDETSLHLSSFMNRAPLALLLVSPDGSLVDCNEKFKQLFADNFSDFDETKNLLDFIIEEDRNSVSTLVKAAHEGRRQNTMTEVTFNNETETHGEIYIASLGAGGGDSFLVYFFDKSQERSLELQFVQAQKMQAVGQLAGGVAHDFNNLLTAIIGFCDLLLMRHMPGDQSFSDINQIKQNANRAANLVRQLLAFSRQQTLRPKILNISDVLSDVANLIRRLIGENINFTMKLGRNLPEVRADQGQLEQVMINLAVNARDAMSDRGGELTISTRLLEGDDAELKRHNIPSEKNYIAISIADTGSGMSPNVQEKIFDPFFTTKKVGEGTGLGLSTVYGIIKQTDGFIFVDSEVGIGTVFHIFLPCYVASAEDDDETEESVEQQPAVRDLSGKGRILLVEDEAPVRMFATRALQNKGYEVVEADCGESGLEVLLSTEHPIDLLITDVIMPNMDGPTLFKKAKEQFPDLPVIFISGYAEDVFRKDLEEDEFEFLAKPFSLNDLASKVKTILG